jgi:hypothetical protein
MWRDTTGTIQHSKKVSTTEIRISFIDINYSKKNNPSFKRSYHYYENITKAG